MQKREVKPTSKNDPNWGFGLRHMWSKKSWHGDGNISIRYLKMDRKNSLGYNFFLMSSKILPLYIRLKRNILSFDIRFLA